jgi:hypothetical protein
LGKAPDTKGFLALAHGRTVQPRASDAPSETVVGDVLRARAEGEPDVEHTWHFEPLTKVNLGIKLKFASRIIQPKLT